MDRTRNEYIRGAAQVRRVRDEVQGVRPRKEEMDAEDGAS